MPGPRHLVLDVDGVLLDTRPLVERAYEKVGYPIPDDKWGYSWETWLIAAVGDVRRAFEVHDQKDEILRDLIASEQPPALAGGEVARSFLRAGWQVGFVTASSLETVNTVLDYLGIPQALLITYQCGPELRADRLVSVSRAGVYIDDLDIGLSHARRADWQFALFTDDHDALCEAVTRASYLLT